MSAIAPRTVTSKMQSLAAKVGIFVVLVGLLECVAVAPPNPLQEMVLEIRPSFGEGLQHLENLFDLFHLTLTGTEFEMEAPSNKEEIQLAIRQTHDSFSETEKITAKHQRLYDEKFLSLTHNISVLEININQQENELTQLKREEGKKQVESAKLVVKNIFSFRKGINKEILAKILAIKATVKEIVDRHNSMAASISSLKSNLISSRSELNRLRDESSLIGSLGSKIRSITTFLTVLHGKVNVMSNTQQWRYEFEPLLLSIDDLIKFLQSREDLMTSLANKQIVDKIRDKYF
ncbi:uncharacterized protein LOC124313263 [Daphnia pulicaria]|nr:uncharacterized protein LOC124313263 [Daphnia pulicaria]